MKKVVDATRLTSTAVTNCKALPDETESDGVLEP